MPAENEIDESSDVASENEYDETDIGRDEQDDEMMAEHLSRADNGADDGPEVKKPKLDPKDPLRPRRKKARRACFACQRAHLTCGDERPCQRCIKRGLADACQDGVRKKAKYLHDAPPEALRPVLGPSYNPPPNGRSSGALTHSPSVSDTSPGSIGSFFPQMGNSPTYNMQYQPMRHNQMSMSVQPDMSYMSQQSPISPSFSSPINQRPGSMHGLPTTMATGTIEIQDQNAFTGPLFDPSNPALYNFDLDGLQFGNQYGAMEFGMLNHMSSGVVETPIDDKSGSLSQQGGSDGYGTVYGNNVAYGQMYPQQDGMMADFSGIDRHNSAGTVYDMQRNYPLVRAYAIESGPVGASPSTDPQASPQSSLTFESSPTTTYNTTANSNLSTHRDSTHQRIPKRQDSKTTVPKLPLGSLSTTPKRTRDSSSIYSSVKEPYSYTTGFHSLIAFIQRRFSANSTLRIAKSLASIRPSFISCTKTLTRQDLIFMEKCFQRTLFEYEEFMRNWGTPTVVCRRTGEIAAVNKEFTLLTGWTKSILLGREANLNINTGKSSNPSTANPSGPPSLGGSGKGGLTTPRLRTTTGEKVQDGRPQPVFLAELLDDNSVIEFYEDFAKLAFGDSRGSVTKRCKLLKYQAKDLGESGDVKDEEKTERKRKDTTAGMMLGGRVSKIDGEFGIGRLERDGKMDCAYCWTVKRDVFDIPMLIVMNFLPCIPI